jgi:hypothetical protein
MKRANYILLLSLGLSAAPVLAQDSSVPGKGNPNGLGDQDYLIQRERILKRMKATSPQQSQQTPEQEGNLKRKPAHDSTYGQGYGSRGETKDAVESKPTIEMSRPERPERPHFEHPMRP